MSSPQFDTEMELCLKQSLRGLEIGDLGLHLGQHAFVEKHRLPLLDLARTFRQQRVKPMMIGKALKELYKMDSEQCLHFAKRLCSGLTFCRNAARWSRSGKRLPPHILAIGQSKLGKAETHKPGSQSKADLGSTSSGSCSCALQDVQDVESVSTQQPPEQLSWSAKRRRLHTIYGLSSSSASDTDADVETGCLDSPAASVPTTQEELPAEGQAKEPQPGDQANDELKVPLHDSACSDHPAVLLKWVDARSGTLRKLYQDGTEEVTVMKPGAQEGGGFQLALWKKWRHRGDRHPRLPWREAGCDETPCLSWWCAQEASG